MKRSPHLRRLSVEHQSALSFANRLDRAARVAPESELRTWATELEYRWRNELAPHFAIEERVWLPALSAAGLADLAQRTAAEHAALAALMVDSALSMREKFVRFASLLQAHVRFEERELFEAAQRTLPESELAALAHAMEG